MKFATPILGMGTLGILLCVSSAAWGWAGHPPNPCDPANSSPPFDPTRKVVLGNPTGSAITGTVSFNIFGDPSASGILRDADVTLRVEKGGEDLFLRRRMPEMIFGTNDLILCRLLGDFRGEILDRLKLPEKKDTLVYTDEALQNFDPAGADCYCLDPATLGFSCSDCSPAFQSANYSAVSDVRFFIGTSGK